MVTGLLRYVFVGDIKEVDDSREFETATESYRTDHNEPDKYSTASGEKKTMFTNGCAASHRDYPVTGDNGNNPVAEPQPSTPRRRPIAK